MIAWLRSLLASPPPELRDGFVVVLECGHWRNANESWRVAMNSTFAPFEGLCPFCSTMQPVLGIFDRTTAIKRTTAASYVPPIPCS